MADLDPEAQAPLIESRSRGRQVAHDIKENFEDWWGAHATSAYALLSHVSLCILFGLAAAVCLKMFGKLVLVVVLVLFIVVQLLALKGYVNLRWERVSQGFKRRIDLDHDGHVGLSDFKVAAQAAWAKVLGYGLPSVAGVLFGFYLGWEWF